MFPLVAEHRGWRIERRPPGFEFTPGLLGKITTFVATPPDGGWAVFAFMYSFLGAGGPVDDESGLSEQAIATVRAQIDQGVAASGYEATFELGTEGWREVEGPRWWVSLADSG